MASDAAQGAENLASFALFEAELGQRESAVAARSSATTQAEAAMNRTRQIVSHFIQTITTPSTAPC